MEEFAEEGKPIPFTEYITVTEGAAVTVTYE